MPEPYIPPFADCREAYARTPGSASARRPRRSGLGEAALTAVALITVTLTGFAAIGFCLALGWFAGGAVIAALAHVPTDLN